MALPKYLVETRVEVCQVDNPASFHVSQSALDALKHSRFVLDRTNHQLLHDIVKLAPCTRREQLGTLE
jgi:hypothetical protein